MSGCVAFARKKTGRKRKNGRVDSVESCVIKMSRNPGIDNMVSLSNTSSPNGPKIIRPLVNVEIKLNAVSTLDAQALEMNSSMDRDNDPNYLIKVERTTPPQSPKRTYDEEVSPLRNSTAPFDAQSCSRPCTSSSTNFPNTSSTCVNPVVKREPMESTSTSFPLNLSVIKPSKAVNVPASQQCAAKAVKSAITPSTLPHPLPYQTTFGNYPMPYLTNSTTLPMLPDTIKPSQVVNPMLPITPHAYSGQMMPVYVPVDYFYNMMNQEKPSFFKPFFPGDVNRFRYPHQSTNSGVDCDLKSVMFSSAEATKVLKSTTGSCFNENHGADMLNNDGVSQEISQGPPNNLAIKQEPVNNTPHIRSLTNGVEDDDEISILEEIIDVDDDLFSKFPEVRVTDDGCIIAKNSETGDGIELGKIKAEKIHARSSAHKHSLSKVAIPRKVNVVMPQISEIVTQTKIIEPVKSQPKISISSKDEGIVYQHCRRADIMSHIKKYPSLFKISTRDTKRMFQTFEKFFTKK